MNRPVSAVGLLIMVAAVVVGFVPTIWSILALFATTIFGGHLLKKHAKESYKGFIKFFGLFVAAGNLLAAGMIMLTPLDYIDKASSAFLNMIVAVVIITLLLKDNEGKQTD